MNNTLLGKLKACGGGTCDHNGSDLDGYPLLARVNGVTITEDGQATVVRVRDAADGTGSTSQIASHLRTTEAHVLQALAYLAKRP